MTIDHEHLRMVEALLFAAEQALSVDDLAERLPEGAAVEQHLETLAKLYSGRGVHLAEANGKYYLRTAPDLAFLLRREVDAPRKLSRAAVETLAIIAYHQPVTRGDIEDIRGVSLSKGTIDLLLEAEWIAPRGRRKSPGRPLMFGTTEAFLVHFGLASLEELPGIAELKAVGLLDSVDAALEALELREEDDGEAAQRDLEEAIDEDVARAGRDHLNRAADTIGEAE